MTLLMHKCNLLLSFFFSLNINFCGLSQQRNWHAKPVFNKKKKCNQYNKPMGTFPPPKPVYIIQNDEPNKYLANKAETTVLEPMRTLKNTLLFKKVLFKRLQNQFLALNTCSCFQLIWYYWMGSITEWDHFC